MESTTVIADVPLDLPQDTVTVLGLAGYSERDLEMLLSTEVDTLLQAALSTRLNMAEEAEIPDGFSSYLRIALDFSRDQLATMDVGKVMRAMQDAFDAARGIGSDGLAEQLRGMPDATGLYVTNFPHTTLGTRPIPVITTGEVHSETTTSHPEGATA